MHKLASTKFCNTLFTEQDYAVVGGLLKEAKDRQEPHMIPAPPDPQTQQLEEQRKQDLHEQQIQFANDKHQMAMQQQQMMMQQKQQAFELQQLQEVQRSQEEAEINRQRFEQEVVESQRQFDEKQKFQQAQAVQKQQQQMPPMPSQHQVNAGAQHQQRQNAIDSRKTASHEKVAVRFDQYGRQIEEKSALPPTLLGGAMGGGAAHFLFPTEEVQSIRDQLKNIKTDVPHEYKQTGPKGSTKAIMGARTARERLLREAYRKNAVRLLKGTGIGLLGGLLTHEILKDR
jgi:hypothetical protein